MAPPSHGVFLGAVFKTGVPLQRRCNGRVLKIGTPGVSRFETGKLKLAFVIVLCPYRLIGLHGVPAIQNTIQT